MDNKEIEKMARKVSGCGMSDCSFCNYECSSYEFVKYIYHRGFVLLSEKQHKRLKCILKELEK